MLLKVRETLQVYHHMRYAEVRDCCIFVVGCFVFNVFFHDSVAADPASVLVFVSLISAVLTLGRTKIESVFTGQALISVKTLLRLMLLLLRPQLLLFKLYVLSFFAARNRFVLINLRKIAR